MNNYVLHLAKNIAGYGDANANMQTHCLFRKFTCCPVTYNAINGNTKRSLEVTDSYRMRTIKMCTQGWTELSKSS